MHVFNVITDCHPRKFTGESRKNGITTRFTQVLCNHAKKRARDSTSVKRKEVVIHMTSRMKEVI